MRSKNHQHKPLTVISATALVIGNMMGLGLVTTTGFLSAEIGNPLLILSLWLLGGILALCGATIYGELGAMMPRAGGEYIYLSRAIHPLAGFLSGWVSLLVGFSAPIALTAYAFGIYLETTQLGIPAKYSAALLISLLTILHLGKVVWVARIHNLLTLYTIVLILVFITAALLSGEGQWSNLIEVSSKPLLIENFAISLVIVSFAYSGWNAASYVAGEIEDAEKALPKALIWGTISVMVMFILLNVVFFFGAPPSILSQDPEEVVYVAAKVFFGGAGGTIVSLLISIALISSVNAMIMAGPRVYSAMAKDGLFFRVFTQQTEGGSPWAGVILQCALALIILITSTFAGLMTYIGVMLSAFSGLTVLSAFILRLKSPQLNRPYRAAWWPFSGMLYLVLVGSMIYFTLISKPEVMLVCLATLLIGTIFYLYRRKFLRHSLRLD